jgi:hypothetical protein
MDSRPLAGLVRREGQEGLERQVAQVEHKGNMWREVGFERSHSSTIIGPRLTIRALVGRGDSCR